MIPRHSTWSRWAGGRGHGGVGHTRLGGGKRPLTAGSAEPWWHEVAISETQLPGSPAPASRSAHQPTPGDTRVRRPHSGDVAGMGDASHHPLCGSERSPRGILEASGSTSGRKMNRGPRREAGSRSRRTALVSLGPFISLLQRAWEGPGPASHGGCAASHTLPSGRFSRGCKIQGQQMWGPQQCGEPGQAWLSLGNSDPSEARVFLPQRPALPLHRSGEVRPERP